MRLTGYCLECKHYKTVNVYKVKFKDIKVMPEGVCKDCEMGGRK